MRKSRILPWSNGIAESTDEFVLAGTGAIEEMAPRFTYHGFQYAEITGWPGRPTTDDLTSWAAFLNVCGKPAKPLTAGRNRMTINLGK